MSDPTDTTSTPRDPDSPGPAQEERQRLEAEAERERFESRIAQSQRLESLGQLAGGVAHDFNNLLAVIINYATFVADEVAAAVETDPSRDWASVSRDVAEIQRAADRAAQLTHRLLAFARRDVVEPQVFVLNEVVGEVEQLLRRTIGEHVELRTVLAGDLWSVTADRGQIEQVLMNLAINARDAMPSGGALTIDTANRTIDDDYASGTPGLKPGRYAQLRVSDTGIGMGPDVVQRAFEPFFTTKPRGEGSGLGLATVYGIITQAGGHASVYSEPGIGTTFTALLPATDETPGDPEEAGAEQRGGGGQTVLVVEDEAGIREVAQRILERNGYTVLNAPSGADAVEIARSEHPVDVLLTDMVMPGMLGPEVVSRIKSLRPEIPVVVMSGYAHPAFDEQALPAGRVLMLEKPFSELVLLAKVREALGGNP